MEEIDNLIKESNKIVMLKFSTTTCGPCKMLSKVMEDIQKEREDIDYMDIYVEGKKDLIEKYQIKSVPAVFIYKNSELKEKFVGLKDKNKMNEIFNSI